MASSIDRTYKVRKGYISALLFVFGAVCVYGGLNEPTANEGLSLIFPGFLFIAFSLIDTGCALFSWIGRRVEVVK